MILYGDKDVVVTRGLIDAQMQGIAGASCSPSRDSGHGIVYDELEQFNQLFLRAVAGG